MGNPQIQRADCIYIVGLLKNQSQWALVTKILELRLVCFHFAIGIVWCQGEAIPWLTTILGGWLYCLHRELSSIHIGRTNQLSFLLSSSVCCHLHSRHFSAPMNILRAVTPNLPFKVNCSLVDRDSAILVTLHNLFFTQIHFMSLMWIWLLC